MKKFNIESLFAPVDKNASPEEVLRGEIAALDEVAASPNVLPEALAAIEKARQQRREVLANIHPISEQLKDF